MTDGKIPPHSLEAEHAVIGACLIDEDATMAVIGILKPEMFYDPKCNHIFSVIYSSGQKGVWADIIVATAELRRLGLLDEVGGAIFITELSSTVVSALRVEEHARIIKECYIKRQYIQFANKLDGIAYDSDVHDLNEIAENEVFKIAAQAQTKEPKRIDECVDSLLKNVSFVINNPGTVVGIPSGSHKIDRLTGGFQKSDLIIIAGRPSIGKTAMALSIAYGMSNIGHPIAFFSLEMSTQQLTTRLVSSASLYSNHEIRNGKVNYESLIKAAETIAKLPIYIDDTPSIGLAELRSKTKKLIISKNIQAVIIDYLQLMTGMGQSREQEVASISRGLKALAKEFNIPVICLSQLNRSLEVRSDKRPMLSDLRESGAIEQDADIVAFIYRPAYYNIDSMKINGEDMNTLNLMLFDIQKHRNGALYPVVLYHNDSLTQIVDDKGDLGINLF